jgi:hypothetical protein
MFTRLRYRSVRLRTTPRATSDLLLADALPTAAPEASSSMLFELSSTTSTLALPITRYKGLLPMLNSARLGMDTRAPAAKATAIVACRMRKAGEARWWVGAGR